MNKVGDYILLLGRSCDRVLQHLAKYLYEHKYKCLFLDHDRIGVDIHLDNKNWYLPDNNILSHNNIRSVFNRTASLVPNGNYKAEQVVANSFLTGMLDYGYNAVFNRPCHVMSNCSKPYQSRLVKDFPLCFPKSNIYANVKLNNLSENIIFKSISSVRSIVTNLSNSNTSLVTEPVLFQEKIIGDNIRVHVIGDSLVAVKIKAKNIDYRYCQDTNFSEFTLPKKIASTCVELAKFLKLYFCGIDLIKSGNSYYFLEANPAPGYSYYENKLKSMPISNALVKLLVSG